MQQPVEFFACQRGLGKLDALVVEELVSDFGAVRFERRFAVGDELARVHGLRPRREGDASERGEGFQDARRSERSERTES